MRALGVTHFAEVLRTTVAVDRASLCRYLSKSKSIERDSWVFWSFSGATNGPNMLPLGEVFGAEGLPNTWDGSPERGRKHSGFRRRVREPTVSRAVLGNYFIKYIVPLLRLCFVTKFWSKYSENEPRYCSCPTPDSRVSLRELVTDKHVWMRIRRLYPKFWIFKSS